MDLDAFRQPLQGLFQQHPVRLAYLFGSQATQRTHPSSDIDVAMLLDESLTPDERFAERLKLLGDLSRIFGTDHVDLVMLNEASPLLAYETLRHGYSRWTDRSVHLCSKTPHACFHARGSSVRRPLAKALVQCTCAQQ